MAPFLDARVKRLNRSDGIEAGGLDQVTSGSVIGVCTRAGNRVDDRASRSSILRIVVSGLDRDLLHRVGIGDLEGLARYRDVIILGAIEQEVLDLPRDPFTENVEMPKPKRLVLTPGRVRAIRFGFRLWIGNSTTLLVPIVPPRTGASVCNSATPAVTSTELDVSPTWSCASTDAS